MRGAGDLATGVAARLWRCGFAVVLTEIAQPLAVRRLVALAEAVYSGEVQVEDLRGVRVETGPDVLRVLQDGALPVLVDPQAGIRSHLSFRALIDARMRKAAPEEGRQAGAFVVGLGPGFRAGVNCHAVVETHRGHTLGRVYWSGAALPDTAIPEPVGSESLGRVLRAPAAGPLAGRVPLGSLLRKGETIAESGGVELLAPFDGALRGLLHDGLFVNAGDKVGDLDPRGVPAYCSQISDKSLAVGGGVLEALLSQKDIRRELAG
jgi:xanthine dehydrogenase accessory factor